MKVRRGGAETYRVHPSPNRLGRGGWSRVLVIDDDPDIGRVVRMLLEVEGYEVLLSEDGLRGLALAQRQQPDVIVLDLMMPVMDGYEVLAQLREDPRTADIAVVVLSALSLPDARDANVKAGETVFLSKPFEPEELLGAIAAGVVTTSERRSLRGRPRATVTGSSATRDPSGTTSANDARSATVAHAPGD